VRTRAGGASHQDPFWAPEQLPLRGGGSPPCAEAGVAPSEADLDRRRRPRRRRPVTKGFLGDHEKSTHKRKSEGVSFPLSGDDDDDGLSQSDFGAAWDHEKPTHKRKSEGVSFPLSGDDDDDDGLSQSDFGAAWGHEKPTHKRNFYPKTLTRGVENGDSDDDDNSTTTF